MAIPELKASLALLSRCVLNFPVGAVTPNDLKELPEKIKDTKHDLRAQKAHYVLLRAQQDVAKLPDKTEDFAETMDDLLNEICNQQINDMALDTCLNSYSLLHLLLKTPTTSELRQRAKILLEKVFLLASELPEMESRLNAALEQERNLKVENDQARQDYQAFLDEHKNQQEKALEKANPGISHTKQQLNTRITKINLMKVLITNIISAAENRIGRKDFWKQIKKHRGIVTLQSIVEMSHEEES